MITKSLLKKIKSWLKDYDKNEEHDNDFNMAMKNDAYEILGKILKDREDKNGVPFKLDISVFYIEDNGVFSYDTQEMKKELDRKLIILPQWKGDKRFK